MKTQTKSYITLLSFILFAIPMNAQQSLHLPNLPDNDPAFNNATVPAPTAEKLATAPSGEFRKLHLREVNRVRSEIAISLAAIPAGEAGQQSPWFIKFQAFKTGLDTASKSRLLRDVLNLIPKMKELSDARGAGTLPESFYASNEIMRTFGYTIIHVIAEYVANQNAKVTAADLTHFVWVFGNRSLISPTAWEDEVLPIDSDGIMILNASKVAAQLKAGSWLEAKDFLRGEKTASDFFSSYTGSGNGLAVLNTRYAKNKATIEAKFNELKTWVAQKDRN